MFNRVLMVCIGNICRSPMAEALLRHRLGPLAEKVRVESAGLSALVGHPADPLAVELLKEKGIDLSGHRARQLDVEMVRDADLVLVMDAQQQRAIQAMYPAATGKVHRLGRWIDADIADPYRKPREAFESALGLIDRGLNELMRFWR